MLAWGGSWTCLKSLSLLLSRPVFWRSPVATRNRSGCRARASLRRLHPSTPRRGSSVLPGARVEKIAGRFELEHKLGAGAFGEAHVARDLETGRKVVLKLIHAHLATNPELVERFRREIRALERVVHPSVPGLVAQGTAEGDRPYYAMEFCEGSDLYHALEAEPGPWALKRCCLLFDDLLSALGACHEAGVVHRDLKPANLFLPGGDPAAVRVLDFGVARLEDAVRLTEAGATVGTPGYMAPEQALGESTDHRADLYALGILLWESIAGRPLFEGDSLTDIVSKQLADEPPPRLMDEARDPTLPPELQELVDHLLQHRPEERPDSAAMVRDQLRDLALQAAVSGDPRGPTPPAGSFAVRRPDPSTAPTLPVSAVKGGSGERSTRPLLLGGIASLLILLAVGGALLWLRDDTPEEVAPSPELLQQLREEAQAATQAEELARQTELLLHEPNRDTRRAAALYVMDFEPADQVPAWVRAVAQLEGAQGCQPIERALAEIRELGDARTRDPVERYYRRTRRRRLRRFYRCVHRDLRQTLEALPEAPDEGAAEGEAAEAEPSG
ncbi:MAG TPA: hypothetical protein DEA08_30740 [Planctomycetes bacterium]|nr:hypothetical protein [Planctomycetota bacterium]